ncbi:MAG: hypothetical protein WEF86_10395 [Gemmatimonadota bacterium]
MTRLLRRAMGAALVLLGMAPFYRLLDPARAGLAAASTRSLLDIYFATAWSGLLLLVPVALLGALFGRPAAEPRALALLSPLLRPRMAMFAAAAALAAGVLAAAFSLLVLDGKPNHVDSIAQLLHARHWAEGHLAGESTAGAFRATQNALFTGQGWVSQYPPGHVLVLALFLAAGIPWAAGPALVAVTVFFAALTLALLLPRRALLVRCAVLLLALSPFLLLLGASYMNHITACAGVTVGAWALCRAWTHRSDHPAGSSRMRVLFAVVAGAAFGLAFMTRPLTTLAAAAALSLLVPGIADTRPDAARVGRVLFATAAGALPFAAALLAYNAHFFGGPATFGYTAALGERAAPGLHLDPWGNLYGLREAVAYTSADLTTLGVHLLETPLSAVLVVGLFLLAAPRLAPGERVLAGWALAPVAANFFYWHHGVFMGPRMLHEATPPWVFLFAIGAVSLVSRVPQDLRVGGFHPRTGAGTALTGALALGLLVLAPQRAFSYGGAYYAVMRTPAPQLERPALVFVHEGWTGRVAMTLAAAQYRLDLVETLLRQNPTCSVHSLATAVAAGDTMLERRLLGALDTVPRAAGLPAEHRIVEGSTFRATDGAGLSPECVQQVQSDVRGVMPVTPLLWQGDLPGDAVPRGALFVRDLGPARNAEAIARYPAREPWLYAMPAPDAAGPVLFPYEQGMSLLWKQQAPR